MARSGIESTQFHKRTILYRLVMVASLIRWCKGTIEQENKSRDSDGLEHVLHMDRNDCVLGVYGCLAPRADHVIPLTIADKGCSVIVWLP